MRICSPRSWIIALAAIGLGLSAQPAKAAFTFSGISVNSVADSNAGESQLFMTVNAGSTSSQAVFTFYNIGSTPMSLTDIYFDDGGRKPSPPADKPAAGNLIVSIASWAGSGSGVVFTTPASPKDLPGGNGATPHFVTTLALSAGASGAPDGINPGESLAITVNLATGKTLANVLAELNNGLLLTSDTGLLDSLRVGIHVQAFGTQGNGSESFINGETDGGGTGGLQGNPPVVPAPAGLILLASGLPILGLRRLLRRKPVAA